MGTLGLLILVLIVAVVMVKIQERNLPPEAYEPPEDPRAKLTATSPNWRSYWLVECESPAEEAFFNAMVATWGFVPSQGELRQDGVTFKLQVRISRYRADFLVGDRLVVEVDGAEWHSSSEAVARDDERDAFMKSLGYTVLRIPARDVFRSPSLVGSRVRDALRDAPSLPPPPPPLTVQKVVQDTAKAAQGVTVDKTVAAVLGAVRTVGDLSEELARRSVEYTDSARAEAEADKARKKWLGDHEFVRQLMERVEVRLAKHHSVHPPVRHPLGFPMDDFWKNKFREEELARLAGVWDARAAAVPDDPEFHRLLAARVDALVDNHPEHSEVAGPFKGIPWVAEAMRQQARARFRWEEEGRLLEQWPQLVTAQRAAAILFGSVSTKAR